MTISQLRHFSLSLPGICRLPAALLLVLLLTTRNAGAAPHVVVSIQPLHSLVAALLEGVGEPKLLIRDTQSAHDLHLRPSDMRALLAADLVVWTDPGLEAPLARVLDRLGDPQRSLAVSRLPGVTRLAPRNDDWGSPGHDHAAAHDQGAIDPHLWLNPRNAMAIATGIAARLALLDPAEAPRYSANAARLQARLTALDSELQTLLAPLHHTPFVVFHDAFQYFERAYDLHPVGAVTLNPERTPGARHVAELRARIVASGARCVFVEPQFQPNLATTLVEGSTARIGVLDPLGSDIAAGPNAYFALMQRLGTNLHACLTGQAAPPSR